MSEDMAYDEGAQAVAAMTAQELAANARDDAPVDPEDLDYDDLEPCGEGMCQCSCGQGCVCGCECPGDDEWKPGECDHCYGQTLDGPLGPIYCACAIGQGAGYEDCRCGPPPGHVPDSESATYEIVGTPDSGVAR
ncbi:hypothetical protein ACIQJT_02305 [Streptomyces sp. NPDC091972]|uniref:hypothetical protein n=1 Tax=Streptomyces sp. NPDC091972 TaxID=3366007 RepID=UPI00380FE17F